MAHSSTVAHIFNFCRHSKMGDILMLSSSILKILSQSSRSKLIWAVGSSACKAAKMGRDSSLVRTSVLNTSTTAIVTLDLEGEPNNAHPNHCNGHIPPGKNPGGQVKDGGANAGKHLQYNVHFEND